MTPTHLQGNVAQRRAAAALVALTCAACATVAGTRQIVSFDAAQRGVEVRDESGELLGTTPFFARIEREHHHELQLVRPGRVDVQHREKFTFRCDYRALSSLLANGVVASLAAGGGPLGVALVFGLGNGIDLWSGAAWACPDAIVLPEAPSGSAGPADLPASPTAASPALQCRTLAVVPPEHEDLLVSQRLAELWWQVHHAAQPCDKLVDPSDSDKLFRRQGVSHETPFRIADRPRKHLNDLGFRTKASHLVVLAVRADGDQLLAQPTVYDLHTLQAVQEPPLQLDLALRAQPLWRRSLAWLARHVQLLPDSVGFAPTQKLFQFREAGTTRLLVDSDTPSWLPALVGNWTLLSVDHPGPYRPWDGTLRFGPQILFGYASRRVTMPGGAQPPSREVTLLELGGLYGVTGTVHTPGGALSAFVGAGWGGAWAWQDGGWWGFRAPIVASVGVAWTAFLTENIFLRVDASSYASQRAQVTGAGYELHDWTALSTTLGWYVPEWRRIVRNLL